MAPTHRPDDPDLSKGAIEGPPNDEHVHGNRNAPALDEDGLPNDEIAICEDVLGANIDGSEGG
ncbi:MAG: hypothetical protein ACRD26_01510 [Vicinamibacterales bacterium]